MQTLVVVELEVARQSLPGLSWGQIFVQIHLLVFDAAPQALGKNIVHRPPPAIHTDLSNRRIETVEILRAGEMASLVAIDDFRRGLCQISVNRC